MTAIDKTFLDESRRHYDELMKNDTVTNCNLGAMIEIMKQYWEPDLLIDTSSVSDIVAFIKRLYVRYDEYLADNTKIIKQQPKTGEAYTHVISQY